MMIAMQTTCCADFGTATFVTFGIIAVRGLKVREQKGLKNRLEGHFKGRKMCQMAEKQ